MTDHVEPPAEIEIQTDEAPTVYIRSVTRNTDQDVLITTAANAEVALTRAWERIRGGHDWVKPLGTLLPIGLALLTTNFIERFSVPATTWMAVFLLAGAASLVWLIWVLISQRRRGPPLTPRQVVDLLKIPPQATPSTSALETAGLVYNGNPAQPQTQGSPEKVPVPAAEPRAARNRVSPSTLSGLLGRRRPRTPAAVQGRAPGSKAPIVSHSANSGGPAPKVSPGGRVRHPNFGVGTVLGVRQGPAYAFIEVRFDDPDVGTKKLREDLAPLRPVDGE